MSTLTKLLLPIAIPIVRKVVREMTPDIRKAVEEFIKKLEVMAKSTPNKFDDIGVDALKGIMGMK